MTYYVSTSGSDSNPGTQESPFLTWQKGFSVLVAGDVLEIRGGVYKPSGVNANNIYFGYCGVYIAGKNGTSANPITVKNYQDEKPVLECINLKQTAVHTGIVLMNCDYWHLIGLEVMNAKQFTGQRSGKGVLGYNVNNCIFENLTGHDNGGSGVAIKWESDNNLILNCDGYNNADAFTGGDDADGIEVSFIQYRAGNPRKNTIRGCRGWHNSDDGFDFYSADCILIVENNWAWRNGAYVGIGSGIKVGNSKRTEYAEAGIVQRIVKNNISAHNDAYGFANNNLSAIVEWENNISFGHVSPTSKYESYGFERWHNNYKSTFKNNVSLEDQNTISGLGSGTGPSIEIGNSWQDGFGVTADDYVSTDVSELELPRKADGSLPDITAFKLKTAPPVDPPTYPPVDPPVDPPEIIIPPIIIPTQDDTIQIDIKIQITGNKVLVTSK